ncbi:dolichyl-phosphate-mannose-protein mannosyltransferase [Pichia kluyveri]|uniref:Dolichyl-phosphate-mannose--protein mannosyltransferase n=1 Tax=Pichia kluyveri TaxID=36015 RepID=A0AAV5R0X2_PICKL|nr:dolichyl-phosphate-mannose-protein mannosyltransferase [Pichia kluyveri]
MAPKKNAKKSVGFSKTVEIDHNESVDLIDEVDIISAAKTSISSSSSTNSTSSHIYTVANIAITFCAFITRFYYIWYPSEVVFDEVHFGKFASYYIERTYFFDLHPPFAKMLIAFVGWLVGFNGKFKFENIGDSYIDNSIPYIPLRSLSAILGTLTVPLMFETLKECNYSVWTCILGSAIVAFDNAHVAETRLILLDATLIISVAASIYCYVKFTKLRNSPFTFNWYKWLTLTGFALSCVISTKYVGVLTFFSVGIAVAVDLWNLLDYKTGLTIRQFTRHFIARFVLLIVVPFFIYLGWFYIHFAILTKSGPGDAFMSSEFQETLGDSILAREAKEINYYDIITIKHKNTDCFLHSHPYNYPLRYDDGRISSQGQQVTCVKDFNEDAANYWEILPVRETDDKRLNRPVHQGDTFRLRHVHTNGYLLTHDVASPLYPTNEEFTVISIEEGDSNRYADTLFKFDPVDGKPHEILKTKGSIIKFLHVPTAVAMWTHDDVLLPEWAFNQQEVNGNKQIQSSENNWVVDKIVGLSGERAKFVPKPVLKLPFFRKWWELQFLMFEHNNKLSSEHPFASQPDAWPLCMSGVSFWTNNDLRQQIFFVGNIPGWWFECAMILVFTIIVVFDQLTAHRDIHILTKEARSKLYLTNLFFLSAYLIHYLPFFLMGRQKFLHHYLPAHLLAALFSASVFEFLFTNNRRLEWCQKGEKPNTLNTLAYVSFVFLLLAVLISSFVFFAPITYGNVSLTPKEVISREWMNIKLHFSK